MLKVFLVILILGQKLAFVRDGNIWIKRLPDEVPVQLIQGGGAERPEWSPSGHWLTYRQNQKTVALSNEGRRVEITVDQSVWSPQRDELAFIDKDGLCVLPLDGSDGQKRIVLKNSTAVQVFGFAWSPDATEFAVSVV